MDLQLILLVLFSGFTIFFGGLLAIFFNHHFEDSPVKPIITHFAMALGAGIILSAVSLVLIPAGIKELAAFELVISFGLGAVTFYLIDRFLKRLKSTMATLLAMLLDYIPESIALGAIVATDRNTAYLLAFFIGLQNFPEAFNAFRELALAGFKTRSSLLIFFFLSFIGLIAAMGGYYLLRDTPHINAVLMVFSSGGIIYLLFQDLIPDSSLKGHEMVAIGGVLGFLIGIVGDKLI